MTRTDLQSLTLVELKALAKKKNVPLAAGARKAEIVKALGAKVAASKNGARTGKIQTPVRAAAKKTTAARSSLKKSVKKSATRTKTEQKAAPVSKSAGGAVAASTSPVREWRMPAGAEETVAAQERIEGAKYYTGPTSLRPSTGGSLPQGYGEERIAFLVRDPQTAFAYWEFPQERLDQERGRSGPAARLCVRIYDVTGVRFDGTNAAAFFDQEVYERIGSWYFDLGRPGRSFCADLGLRSPDGSFRTLVRSNTALMPRETISDGPEGEEEEFLRLSGLPGSGLSSPQLQELMRKRRLLEISSPGQLGRKTAAQRRG